MSDYYGDYYSGLITGNKPYRVNIDYDRLEKYIRLGLSSVKIAKIFEVSYATILNKTDKELPKLSKMLRDNGKKHMIRRKSDKAS